MAFFDITLLIFLGGFVLFGLWFGFLHSLGALLGTALGALLASRWYEAVAQLIYSKVGGSLNITRIVIFLIIFVIINRIVGFGFWIVEKITGVFTRLPFLKSVNRLAGGVFGLVEGVFVLGLTLIVATRLPFLTNTIHSSKVAKELMDFARILVPLLPEALKAAQQIPQLPLPTPEQLQGQIQDIEPLQKLIK